MRTQFNDQEDEALQGLPWLAQLLYLRGLRPYMDYASGIVGVKRGVSYQGLGETLYREPGQGKTEFGPPTLKALRHAVSLLERAGLLVKIAADHRLIFQLVLATRDDSVQKKWGTFGADLGQTKQGTDNNNQNIDLEDKRGRFGADPDPEKWGTHPVSGIREKKKPPTPLRVFALPPTVDAAIWAEFEQHRQDIRKPLSPLSRRKNAAILETLPHDQQRTCIDSTIANGWTGLFPPKLNGQAIGARESRAQRNERLYAEQFARVAAHDWSEEPANQMG